MNHCQIIREARERLGLSLDEAAASVGISMPHFRDLEEDEDELFMTMSFSEITRLCRLLQLSPRHLLASEPSSVLRQPQELRHLILSYNRRNHISVDEFEEQAGWKVQPFLTVLTDPQHQFQEWNVDCLRDICSVLGVDCVEFVPA